MKTTMRLGSALITAGAPKWMIDQALDGYYDDYLTPIATPIMQLVADAEAYGLDDIAARAKNGEFDASKEESDAWMKREGKDLLGGTVK